MSVNLSNIHHTIIVSIYKKDESCNKLSRLFGVSSFTIPYHNRGYLLIVYCVQYTVLMNLCLL